MAERQGSVLSANRAHVIRHPDLDDKVQPCLCVKPLEGILQLGIDNASEIQAGFRVARLTLLGKASDGNAKVASHPSPVIWTILPSAEL